MYLPCWEATWAVWERTIGIDEIFDLRSWGLGRRRTAGRGDLVPRSSERRTRSLSQGLLAIGIIHLEDFLGLENINEIRKDLLFLSINVPHLRVLQP